MNDRNSFSKSAISHANETCRKLNPQLFGVGGLEAQKPQQKRPLEPIPSRAQSRRPGVVYRVCIIAALHRRHDSDNLIGGCKPLRDAIAKHLGVDDSDENITWEYGQFITTGQEGTIVRIEAL